MTWMNNLLTTYDYLQENDYQFTDEQGPNPICHLVQQAQIFVVLDSNGTFVRAEKIEKDDAETLIPVTEKSAIRTANSSPHPLYDNLVYLVSNWGEFYDHKKGNETIIENYHKPYMKNLKEWAQSDYSNEWVNIVYKYIDRGNLLNDLIESGVLVLNEQRMLDDKSKIQSTDQVKSLVRFGVEKDGELTKLWQNDELIQSYIDYYLDKVKNENTGICYVTGEKTHIADKHGKYIRFAGDGAKLISSNDNTNFTYRGRFNKAKESLQIGYEASEKAHNVLRWLIQKQGFIRDGYTVIAWANKGIEIENPVDEDEQWFGEMDEDIIFEYGQKTAEDLNKAINSLSSSLLKKYNREELDDRITIMSLDAATPGRLAILYYQELGAKDYVERLVHWKDSTTWVHRYKKNEDKELLYFMGSPSLIDIVNFTFGHQQDEKMVVDNKLFKSSVQRLLPCVVNKARIPMDFIQSSVRRASNPMKMSWFNWQKTLSISCSLLKKYYKEKYEEEWSMALNKESTDRSYLYGRLLAIADKVESSANYINDIDRMTTAMRYMDSFSKKPFATWKIIETSLVPYWGQISKKTRSFYKNLINEIMTKFTEEGFSSTAKLDGKYLLGFHSQLFELTKSFNEDK